MGCFGESDGTDRRARSRLTHALAEEHVEAEYERYQQQERAPEAAEPSSDFDRVVRHLKALSGEPGES